MCGLIKAKKIPLSHNKDLLHNFLRSLLKQKQNGEKRLRLAGGKGRLKRWTTLCHTKPQFMRSATWSALNGLLPTDFPFLSLHWRCNVCLWWKDSSPSSGVTNRVESCALQSFDIKVGKLTKERNSHYFMWALVIDLVEVFPVSSLQYQRKIYLEEPSTESHCVMTQTLSTVHLFQRIRIGQLSTCLRQDHFVSGCPNTNFNVPDCQKI